MFYFGCFVGVVGLVGCFVEIGAVGKRDGFPPPPVHGRYLVSRVYLCTYLLTLPALSDRFSSITRGALVFLKKEKEKTGEEVVVVVVECGGDCGMWSWDVGMWESIRE